MSAMSGQSSGLQGRRVSFTEAATLVKTSLDIVDAVSRHVSLKRQGRNHWGVCPFHKEKTPSFSVAADKGLFKCFGCGEAGDAIGFLMKVERKSYPDLIRETAEAMGLEVDDHETAHDQDGVSRSLLLALNAAALDYFQQSLASPAGQHARRLLENRQFPERFWHEAQMGYAPEAWQGLMQFIQRSGEFAQVQNLPKALVEAGLLIEKMDDKTGNVRYFDRFRHRLMIPITDAQNRVVAFGGRAIAAPDDPNGMPKYMNSPETRLYQKSNLLFGLPTARAAIAAQKSAVVMEGYFDVLTAHRQGVSSCVASCGTALTEQQAKILQRAGAETIYLAFDADQAGQQAAISAIQRLEVLLGRYQASGHRLTLKILTMPDDLGVKDPDELLREAQSPEDAQELWQRVLDAAQDAFGFKCDRVLSGLSLDPDDPDALQNRLEAAHRLVPVLASLPSRILQAEYIAVYAKRCGLDETSLTEDVARYAKSLAQEGSATPFSEASRKHFETIATNRDELATFPLERSFTYQQEDLSQRTTPSGMMSRSPLLNKTPGHAPGRPPHRSMSPVSRLRAAETLLLKLLLMNTASLQAFYPRLVNVSFTEADLASIWAAIVCEVTAQGAALLEDLARLTHAVQDHLHTHEHARPEIARSFADLLFHAGDLAETLVHARRTTTLPSSSQASSLVTLPPSAEKAFQDALKSHAHAVRLTATIPISVAMTPKALMDLPQEDVPNPLEHQYALREQLPGVHDKPHQLSIRSVLGWPSRKSHPRLS